MTAEASLKHCTKNKVLSTHSRVSTWTEGVPINTMDVFEKKIPLFKECWECVTAQKAMSAYSHALIYSVILNHL